MQHQNRAGPRLHALTGTSAGPVDVAGPDAGAAASGPTAVDGREDGADPDAVDDGRALRERAVRSALAAYTAAHGHPVEQLTRRDARGGGPVRWTTTLRAAVGAAVVLALLAGTVVLRSCQQTPSSTVLVAPAQQESDEEVAAPLPPSRTAAPEVVVHVVGEVVTPGLVRLPAGSRVDDALEAAGGATPGADLAALNLARPVADGEQVHVPRPGEATGAAAPAVPGAAASDLTDLNSADAAALEQLPGIGPVLAERIVAWRAEHGRFSTVDELGEVTGIGARLLDGLRDSVRVG